MDNHTAYQLLMDFLEKEEHQPSPEKMAVFLDQYPQCRQPWEEIKEVYLSLEKLEIPEISGTEEVRLRQLLARATSEKKAITARISWFPAEWRNAAAAILVFALGIGAGYGLRGGGNTEIQRLTAQIDEMKETMMLTLLEQPAATDRLKAVNMSGELDHPDSKVIQALLHTLNHDPNVNVRLVTVEALSLQMNKPEVRAGVIQSIGMQDAPMVQLALAELMLSRNEKSSVPQLRQLLDNQNLDDAVRQKIEETVTVLM